MLHLLRKHQYGIMLVVAIIVIVAFAFFYDPNYRNGARLTDADGQGLNVLGTRVSPAEVTEIEQSLTIIQSLRGQQFDFNDPVMQHLIGITSVDPRVQELDRNSERVPRDFVVTTALARVEARRLGISASEAEIEQRIQSLSKFQRDGKFDGAEWEAYINAFGGDSGARKKVIYHAVGDMVIFDKLSELVGQGLPVSKTKIDLEYINRYQKVTVATIPFAKKDFENQEVPAEEIQKYYDAHKEEAELKSEEKRTFLWTLVAKPKDEELKDLDATAKAEKLKEHKKVAAQLMDRLASTDRGNAKFEELATALKLEVKTAAAVARSTPPDELKDEPTVLTTVFGLPEPGRSEVQEGTKGYYIVELASVEPPKVVELDAVKEKITTKLKEQKVEEKFTAAVKEAREKIKAALDGGKSIADAAKEAGKEATEQPAFSQNKPLTGNPDYSQILSASHTLEVGALSDPLKTADGSLLVYVVKKELPKDPKMDDQKKTLAKSFSFGEERGQSSAVFKAWFSSRKREAIASLAKK